MAQAFRSGKLPAPLPQPTGTPEQAAAELAKRVMAEDEQSTAALLTAVQMSGFSVRADDGSLAYESVKPGQGIMIDAWEVAALAKLFGDGMQIKLTDLSNAFASPCPSLKNAPVAKLFVDGLRGAAQGNQPAMRFWADFIAELGRQSRQHYDLLAPYVDTGKVDLDAIQVSLILRRLAADLMIQEGARSKRDNGLRFASGTGASARWEHASYDVEGGMRPYIRDARLASGEWPEARARTRRRRFKPALHDERNWEARSWIQAHTCRERSSTRSSSIWPSMRKWRARENMARQHRKPMPCSR